MSAELTYDLINREPVYFEKIMLVRLMLDPQFAKLASAVLFVDHEGQEARSFQMPRHAGLAQVALMYHAHGGPVTPQLSWEFVQTCMSHVAQLGKLPTGELQEVWEYFFQLVVAGQTSAALILSQTNLGMTYWLKQRRCEIITQRSRTERWESDKLSSYLRAENSFVDGISKSTEIAFDIWEVLAHPMPDVERLRTSIAQLNLRLGGGFGRGEAFLFVGASGAGKSVTSSQFTSEWALANKKVALVTTERTQSTNEFTMRLLSQHCKIPFEQVVNGFRPEKLQPSQLQAVEEFKQYVNKRNFQIIEWFKKPKRDIRAGLRDELLKVSDEMGGLDAFALDWIGGSLDEEEKNDPKKIRLAYNSACETVSELAGELNCAAITFAQAHNKTGKNKARVDSSCTQESSSMDKSMTGGIGISAIQSSEVQDDGQGDNYVDEQFFFIFKARKGRGGLVPVKRMFGYQKYVDRDYKR